MTTAQKIEAILNKMQALEINSAQVFNTNTLAQYLGVSVSTIQSITRPGTCLIKYSKVGKTKCFTRQAVTDFLEKYSREPLSV